MYTILKKKYKKFCDSVKKDVHIFSDNKLVNLKKIDEFYPKSSVSSIKLKHNFIRNFPHTRQNFSVKLCIFPKTEINSEKKWTGNEKSFVLGLTVF